MHFQIHRELGHRAVQTSDNAKGVRFDAAVMFTWTLEKKEGPVCKSAYAFDSVREARADIAAAKKTMAGVQRTKVLNPDER